MTFRRPRKAKPKPSLRTGYSRALVETLIRWETEEFPITRQPPPMGWWRFLQDAHRAGPEVWAIRYRLYLRSADWHALRAHVLARAEWRCQACGVASPKLDVHHQTYERVGREAQGDLRAVCRGCHDTLHTGYTKDRKHLAKRLRSRALMAAVKELAVKAEEAPPEPPRRIRRRPGGAKPAA